MESHSIPLYHGKPFTIGSRVTMWTQHNDAFVWTHFTTAFLRSSVFAQVSLCYFWVPFLFFNFDDWLFHTNKFRLTKTLLVVWPIYEVICFFCLLNEVDAATNKLKSKGYCICKLCQWHPMIIPRLWDDGDFISNSHKKLPCGGFF
jgi:hypothetical protein